MAESGSRSRPVLGNEDGSSDDWPHKPDSSLWVLRGQGSEDDTPDKPDSSLWVLRGQGSEDDTPDKPDSSLWVLSGQGSEDDTQRSWGQRMFGPGGPWEQQGRETSPWSVWVTSPANTIVRRAPSGVNDEDINTINSSINTININVTSALPLSADSEPVLSGLHIFCLIFGALLTVFVTFLVWRSWCWQYQCVIRCGRSDCKKHVLEPLSRDGVTWRQKGSALGQACYWACACRWCAVEKWERDGESLNSSSEHQQTRSTLGNRSILDRVADHLTGVGPSDSSRLHDGSGPADSTHLHSNRLNSTQLYSTPHSVSSYRPFPRPGPIYLNCTTATDSSRIQHHTMLSAIHSVHSDHSFWKGARGQPRPAAPPSSSAAESKSSRSFGDRVVSYLNRRALSKASLPATVQQRPAPQRREDSHQSSSYLLDSDQYSEDSSYQQQQQPADPPARRTARARGLALGAAGHQDGGGADNQNAGAGHQNAGAGHQGAGAGHQNAGAGHQGAGAGHQGAGAGHQGAGAGHQGAGAGHQGAGAGHQGAGAGHQGAGAGHQNAGAGHQDLGLQRQVSGGQEPRVDHAHQPPQLSRTSLQSWREGKASSAERGPRHEGRASSEESGPRHDGDREADGAGGCLAGGPSAESLAQHLDLSSECESRASGETDRPSRNVGVNLIYVVKQHGHLSGTHADPGTSLTNGNLRGASQYAHPAGHQALDDSGSVLENENNLHCVEETVSDSFSALGLPLDSDVDTMSDAASEVLVLHVHGQHVEKFAESKPTTVHPEQRIRKTENTASTNEEKILTKQSVRQSVEKLDKSEKTDSIQQNGEGVSYFADVSGNSGGANYTSSLYRIREYDSSNISEYSTTSHGKSLAMTEDSVSSNSAQDDTASSWLLQGYDSYQSSMHFPYAGDSYQSSIRFPYAGDSYQSSIHFPYAGLCPPDTRQTKSSHSTDIECSPSDQSSRNSRSIVTTVKTTEDLIRLPRGSHSLHNTTYTIGVSETAEGKRADDHKGQTSLGGFKVTDTSIASSYHRRLFNNTNLHVHNNAQPVFTKHTTVPDGQKDPPPSRSVLIPITDSERQSGDLHHRTSSTSPGKGSHDTLAKSSSVATSEGKGMRDILAKGSESTASSGKALQDGTAKNSAPTASQGKSFQKNIAGRSSRHGGSVLSDQTHPHGTEQMGTTADRQASNVTTVIRISRDSVTVHNVPGRLASDSAQPSGHGQSLPEPSESELGDDAHSLDHTMTNLNVSGQSEDGSEAESSGVDAV